MGNDEGFSDIKDKEEISDGQYYHLCKEMSNHFSLPSKRVYVQIKHGDVTSLSYGDIGSADRINFCPHCGTPKKAMKNFAENRLAETLVTQDEDERSKVYPKIKREFLERFENGS